ncbi:hypothetical protein F5Y19DRAFT_2368 [Xylariaceae sp. FL1651]|nr:hypothetical protein F5Y19DRAFT_2368 [Xylariaceae sp. FL1651]
MNCCHVKNLRNGGRSFSRPDVTPTCHVCPPARLPIPTKASEAGLVIHGRPQLVFLCFSSSISILSLKSEKSSILDIRDSSPATLLSHCLPSALSKICDYSYLQLGGKEGRHAKKGDRKPKLRSNALPTTQFWGCQHTFIAFEASPRCARHAPSRSQSLPPLSRLREFANASPHLRGVVCVCIVSFKSILICSLPSTQYQRSFFRTFSLSLPFERWSRQMWLYST